MTLPNVFRWIRRQWRAYRVGRAVERVFESGARRVLAERVTVPLTTVIVPFTSDVARILDAEPVAHPEGR